MSKVGQSDATTDLATKLAPWRFLPIALIVIAIAALLQFQNLPPIPKLQALQFDLMQQISPRKIKDRPVVIVAIDDESLKNHGQWPWPRALMAKLLGKINSHKPKVIAFDLLFSEPGRLSPDQIIKSLPGATSYLRSSLASLPDGDALFARAIRSAPVIMGVGASHNVAPQKKGDLPRPARHSRKGSDAREKLPKYPGVIASIDQLSRAGKGRAALNYLPSVDGVVRKIPLAVNVNGVIYPSLAIDVARVFQGRRYFKIHSDKYGISGVAAGRFFLPTEPDGTIWLRFNGHDSRRFVTASEVLSGEVDGKQLTGKVVLVGNVAGGLVDIPATPIDPAMYGVEIHAQLIEMLSAGDSLTRPRNPYFEITLLICLSLLVSLATPALRPVIAGMIVPVFLGALGLAAWIGFQEFKTLLDVGSPGIAGLLCFGVMVASKLNATDRQRQILALDLADQRAAAERMAGELNAARRIQLGMLPRGFPAFPERSDFDIHANLEPAKEVGGDLYDIAMLDERHLFFLVGDVSGKGVPASLFMALTKALCSSTAGRLGDDLATIICQTNNEIGRVNPESLFVTMLAGILDVETGIAEWCCAGHDSPILLREGSEPEMVPLVGGPPLCMIEDFPYECESTQLQPGDTLLLYTDGVTEALNVANEMYTPKRLMAVMDKIPPNVRAKLANNMVFDDVQAFAKGRDPFDDVTVISVRWTPTKAPAEQS